MLPTHPTTHPTRVPTRAGAGAHTLPHPLTHTRTHPSTRARTHTHASAHAHAHARSRRSSTRHAPHQRRPAHLRGGSPAPTPRRPEAWRAEPRRAAPGREACSGQPGDRWLVPPALTHGIDAWRPIPCHASLTARAQPCGAREVARRALGLRRRRHSNQSATAQVPGRRAGWRGVAAGRAHWGATGDRRGGVPRAKASGPCTACAC